MEREQLTGMAEYMQGSNGGRRRSFKVGDFAILVEPHEDDDRQRAFTAHAMVALGVAPRSRLIGLGCVRPNPRGGVSLLNRRSGGWASRSYEYASWSELMSCWDLKPVACGTDEHGEYVAVSS